MRIVYFSPASVHQLPLTYSVFVKDALFPWLFLAGTPYLKAFAWAILSSLTLHPLSVSPQLIPFLSFVYIKFINFSSLISYIHISFLSFLSLIYYSSPPESLRKRADLPGISTKHASRVTIRLGTYCISRLGNATQYEGRIPKTDKRARDIPYSHF